MNDSPHTGSTLDSLLLEEGLLDEAEAVAPKRVLSWQLEEAIRERGTTKSALAKAIGTSRSQLDRLLDPTNVAVSLEIVTRAAHALGKRLELQLTPELLDLPLR